jgi:hypothetical protein
MKVSIEAAHYLYSKEGGLKMVTKIIVAAVIVVILIVIIAVVVKKKKGK